jgi:oxygen-independent coproporphyrinogen-3 oxidase
LAEQSIPLPGGLVEPPPLGLYVHIPWCIRKCPYCDFNSHALAEPLPEARYLEALARDVEKALPEIWGRPVETVFFGGGTPSLFSPEAVDRLLTMLRTLLPLRPWAEVTLEANPGTFERERFAAYRDAGVNRLSLGIQSFNAGHLKALGRIHDDREARAAVESARTLFDNINLDLMYALPGQGLDELDQDLQVALSYAPQHLSCYHLTVEPHTAFAAAPPPLPDDDLAEAMQERVEESLSAAGYDHYETSAYALPGRECAHNLNYWLFGDYLGIGAGAHSKLSFHDRILRRARAKLPRAYMDWALSERPPGEERVLKRDDLKFEFMMNALRLHAGFDDRLFQARTGLPILALRQEMALAEARDLLEQEAGMIRPTVRGRRFLNDLLQLFLA